MTGRSGERADARDEGAGTVLVLGLTGAVLALTLGLAAVVIGVVARSDARAAADLAALAAAGSIRTPRGVVVDVAAVRDADPCGRARAVATANGAHLTRCDVGEHGDVDVEVVLRRGVSASTAGARAGPAWLRGRS